MVLVGVPMSSWWYVWTAPAWFGFYLYSVRSKQRFVAADVQVSA
jgi:hypothetical protein